MMTCSLAHLIKPVYDANNAPVLDANGLPVYDSNNFEVSIERMISEGVADERVLVSGPGWLVDSIYRIVYGEEYNSLDPNLYYKLSAPNPKDANDPNFPAAWGALIDKYLEVGSEKGVDFIFFFVPCDEPGTDKYKRLLADRLYTIAKDRNAMTYLTYMTECDEDINVAPTYNTPNDINIPPLTSLIDYKAWQMGDVGAGYAQHSDPCYHGSLSYYTTGQGQYESPAYNRFLHGLFAFKTGAKVVTAYAMGDYVGDPYNDFDPDRRHIFPFTYPDFLYAYPTWSGELLPTIGGLEGIREGIKDAKYIATLQNILNDPCTNWSDPNVTDANDFLVELKGRIDPNYMGAYANKATELGYYPAILEAVSDANNANDFEAFTDIRKTIADYIEVINDPNS